MKGKFVLLPMLATGSGEGRHLSKGRLPLCQSVGRNFYRLKVRAICRNIYAVKDIIGPTDKSVYKNRKETNIGVLCFTSCYLIDFSYDRCSL